MTEDEMVGCHHQLNGHEFEQTQEGSEGQGSLVCCSPWGCKESDTTYRLNNKWACGPSYNHTHFVIYSESKEILANHISRG